MFYTVKIWKLVNISYLPSSENKSDHSNPYVANFIIETLFDSKNKQNKYDINIIKIDSALNFINKSTELSFKVNR